jgi:hypothetical protein
MEMEIGKDSELGVRCVSYRYIYSLFHATSVMDGDILLNTLNEALRRSKYHIHPSIPVFG